MKTENIVAIITRVASPLMVMAINGHFPPLMGEKGWGAYNNGHLMEGILATIKWPLMAIKWHYI